MKLNQKQEELIAYIKKRGGRVTTGEVAKEYGISHPAAYKRLRILEGILSRDYSEKGNRLYWVLEKEPKSLEETLEELTKSIDELKKRYNELEERYNQMETTLRPILDTLESSWYVDEKLMKILRKQQFRAVDNGGLVECNDCI